jgi:predicted RNase H-like HicB family nuclease
MKPMKTLTYNVRIEPMEEGGYTVEVPALPGCVTWGRTFEEAITMAKEAIEGFVESLQKHHEEIPVESQPHQSRILGIQVHVPTST